MRVFHLFYRTLCLHKSCGKINEMLHEVCLR
nr:MAG TPA: hypothetical protein [Caudoviricetes sp.]